MPKVPRLTAADAESMLLRDGFVWLRSKGSHRIYAKGGRRVVVPFHGSAILHPKIVKQVFEATEDARLDQPPPIL
jgi:predicted RNA binding protein YcfA (HicA-like mRNA interferase family)